LKKAAKMMKECFEDDKFNVKLSDFTYQLAQEVQGVALPDTAP